MNLDELVQWIADSDADLRLELVRRVEEWKKNDATIEDLVCLFEKWHRDVSFKTSGTSDDFYRRWQQYRRDAVEGVGGMTMNERLYVFSLFCVWDASDDAGKVRIRKKVNADA